MTFTDDYRRASVSSWARTSGPHRDRRPTRWRWSRAQVAATAAWAAAVRIPLGMVVKTICRGVMLGMDPVFAVATPTSAPGPAFDALALVPGLNDGLPAIGAGVLRRGPVRPSAGAV